jgi:hypothetical protein
MRRILFLLIASVIAFGATAQSLVDTPRIVTSLSMDIAGNVDSVTELTLGVKILEVGASLQVKGDSGHKIITIPDTSFIIKEERAWKFDEKGRLLSEVFRNTDNRKNELEEVTASVYNYKKQSIASVINRKEGSSTDSAAYVYAAGKLSMQELYDARGKYKGRIQYFQNKEKLLSTISEKNADLELKKMRKYWYDADKNLTSITYHDNVQKLVLTQKVTIEDDSAGNKHVMIFDYARQDTCTGMHSYLLNDAGGHMEDVTQDEKGNVLYISTAKFNDNNHMTEQVIFTDVKVVMTYTYEYDSHKNWTLKRIYRNGVPEMFVRRTIIYRN